MLWQADSSGFVFESQHAGVLFPMSAMPMGQHRLLHNRSAWQAVEHLWGDGALEETANGWRLPFSSVYVIDQDVRVALGLPEPTKTTAAVRTLGSPGHATLRIAVDVSHPAIGTLEGAMERVGPVYLPRPSAHILVTNEVYELLCLMEQGPSGSAIEDHLEYLAAVQAAAEAASADTDAFLRSQELVFPTSVRLEAEEESADRIKLSAQVDLGDGDVYSPEGSPPRVHRSKAPNGRTRRIVMKQALREQAQTIAQQGVVQGSQVPRFLENPEAFVPPGLDLSEFSKRVIGFKTVVYNSRPYLHINPSSGGWFEGVPGLELQDTRENAAPPTGAPPKLERDEYRRMVAQARSTGDDWVRHGDGWVHIDPRATKQLDELLSKGELTPEGSVRLPSRAVLEIYENLESLEFNLPPAEDLGIQRHLTDYPDPPLPAALKASLMPHQRIGYRWLSLLHQKGTGGLLADDMGLGKTVQVIAHMTRLAELECLGPSLIVCPGTLIDNWKREFSRFAPSIRVSAFLGGNVDASEFALREVVITSYDTLRQRQLQLAKVDWKTVVCDEAQYAKNPTAQRTAAVKALKADHRMALTGTPVENGMIEFWCILDFVRPGHLGSWSEFRDSYERPLVAASDEESRRPIVDGLIDHLRPHYLRRMKDEVLKDLPPKNDNVVHVGFGERQFELYRQVAALGKDGGRGQALAAITTLLQVCAHPEALNKDFGGEVPYVPGECPKLDATIAMLESISARSEKALIFTRFIGIQRILQRAIYERFEVWPDLVNGEVTHNRQGVVDAFQAVPGFNVLILSHDVGGVGLNITEANHVIHYTRPWNPAKENQATDRAHRIGQIREVTVHYPVLSDERFVTVEEKLERLLESKRALAKDVLRTSREMQVDAADLLGCLDVPGA